MPIARLLPIRLAALAAAFCLALSCGVSAQAAAQEAHDGALLKRVTLMVADIDRALTIYEDILGFGVARGGVAEEDSARFELLGAPSNGVVEVATLNAGDTQVAALALVERPLGTAAAGGTPGLGPLFRVPDITEIFWRIEALGLRTSKPLVIEGPAKFDYRQRAFVDYDGHVVTLYQAVPKR
ncbi:MAG: VOC family protein [Pseudomonadota bacterium]